MKRNLSWLVMVALLVSALVAMPMRAEAATTVPVTGSIPGGGSFVGSLTVTAFQVLNNELVAVGTLSGSLFNKSGKVIGTVTNAPITLPINILRATCTILKLQLGPLDLTLLGLQVHLDKVVLTITSTGTGLGALLCQLAALLANPLTTLQQLVDVLNAILAGLP